MINYRDNCYLYKKTAFCFWFTGLQASGKTTIAKYFSYRYNCILLDGDAIRTYVNYDLNFSKSDITNNIKKISGICKILMDQGNNVCVSCVSKFRSDRELARSIIGEEYFNEVYIHCSLKDLIDRRSLVHPDTKLLFNDYEKSNYSYLDINTSIMNKKQCVDHILLYYRKMINKNDLIGD